MLEAGIPGTKYGLRLEDTPMGEAWLEALETSLEIDCGLPPEAIEAAIPKHAEMIEQRYADGEEYDEVAVTICEIESGHPPTWQPKV